MHPQVDPTPPPSAENAEALLRALDIELRTKRQARAARTTKRHVNLSALLAFIIFGGLAALAFLFYQVGTARQPEEAPAAVAPAITP